MTLTIQVPDEQAQALQNEMEQRGFAVQVEADIPDWHKRGLDRIRANTPPDAYIPLDEFLKEWESE